jgi:hypothetical protein
MLITEHSRPRRSTTADHIRFEEKIPPLLSFTMCDSWSWTLLTTCFGIPQDDPSRATAGEPSTAPSAANVSLPHGEHLPVANRLIPARTQADSMRQAALNLTAPPAGRR